MNNIKNSHEYDQSAEDTVVAELISQREEEEALEEGAEAGGPKAGDGEADA